MSATSLCLPYQDAAGADVFGLRMSQLTLTKPLALTVGIVKTVIQGGMLPKQPACGLFGQATFNWLLKFDANAGTITTGGALPVANPAAGYSFVDAMYVSGGVTFHAKPITLTAPLAGCDFTSSAGDLVMPIYLDGGGVQAVLLPLHQVVFHDGQVSQDHNCIGQYNAANLDPANNCLSDGQNPTYIEGAQVDGLITLEESDSVIIAALNESLCVLLSGDAQTFGDGGSPNKCKRVNGKIVYQGDWCAATNQAASGACHDAVQFSGSFAAGGVEIN